MDLLPGIVGGLFGSGFLVWLLRGWITERLRQSIQHEYSQQLENHKAELNLRIQSLNHDNQVRQLRTSLFFDHQRNAFAAITAKIAEVNRVWMKDHYDHETGLTGPVPWEAFRGLRDLIEQHSLFLTEPCLLGLDLLLSAYGASFPSVDAAGVTHARDPRPSFDQVEFLAPIVSELFRQEIGVAPKSNATRRLALYGGLRLVNQYHFADAGTPPAGSLQIEEFESPGETLARAERHADEVVALLEKLQGFLGTETGYFLDAKNKTERYLALLT